MAKESAKKDVDIEEEKSTDVDVELEERDEKRKDAKKDEGKEGKKDEGKDEQDDERIVIDSGDDEEREKIRERRREEKKQRRERQREEAEKKEREIAQLRTQITQLTQKQQMADQRFAQTDVQRLQGGIAQAQREIEECEEIMKRGITEQKGEAVAAAQRAMMEANNRLSHYTQVYQNMQQQHQKPQQADPGIVSLAQAWMAKNRWYDGVGRDPDSRVARAIDDQLTEEGVWDARTPHYWTEFDKRIAKYLPHRLAAKPGSRAEDEEDDEDDDRGSPTGGSARESASSGGKTTYRLSAARVAALKEAGQWEQFNSDKKFRARMVERFKEVDIKVKS